MNKLLGGLLFLLIGVMFIPVVGDAVDNTKTSDRVLITTLMYDGVTDNFTYSFNDAIFDELFNALYDGVIDIIVTGTLEDDNYTYIFEIYETTEDDVDIIFTDFENGGQIVITLSNDGSIDTSLGDGHTILNEDYVITFEYTVENTGALYNLVDVIGIIFVIGIVVGGVAYIKFN